MTAICFAGEVCLRCSFCHFMTMMDAKSRILFLATSTNLLGNFLTCSAHDDGTVVLGLTHLFTMNLRWLWIRCSFWRCKFLMGALSASPDQALLSEPNGKKVKMSSQVFADVKLGFHQPPLYQHTHTLTVHCIAIIGLL